MGGGTAFVALLFCFGSQFDGGRRRLPYHVPSDEKMFNAIRWNCKSEAHTKWIKNYWYGGDGASRPATAEFLNCAECVKDKVLLKFAGKLEQSIKRATPLLPLGWTKHKLENVDMYFNEETGESTPDRPMIEGSNVEPLLKTQPELVSASIAKLERVDTADTAQQKLWENKPATHFAPEKLKANIKQRKKLVTILQRNQ